MVKILERHKLIHQATALDKLTKLSQERPLTVYCGFDLTAPSLHIGSLIPIRAMRLLAQEGHRIIILLGTTTTRIGDPSGKSETRPVLSPEAIRQNREGIMAVLSRLVPEAEFVDNDWFEINYIDFITHYGRLISVNRMLALDSVKSRLENQSSMSFLEFNYSLIQAIDFVELASRRQCDLQIGGSDQWGNIVTGVDLTRRLMEREVFGLTTPLLLKPDGTKMGKTAGGSVWLDPEMTPPADFWDFWRNVPDAQVDDFLIRLTDHEPQGDINDRKIVLADALTAMVHGESAAILAREAAVARLRGVASEDTPVLEIAPRDIADAFLQAGLVSSIGDAVRMAKNNGLKIDGELVADARAPFPKGEAVIQVGKRKMCRIVSK